MLMSARRVGLGLCIAVVLAVVGCPSGGNTQETNSDGDTGGTGGAPPGFTGPAGFVLVPDPLSGENPRFPLLPADEPSPGASVQDNRLRLVQTRATARPGLRHEYSRHDPFNCDCSLILLMDIAEGTWCIYRAASLPYDQEGALVRTLEFEEPRWDPSSPRTIWATRDFSIYRIDVEAGEDAVVKDFGSDSVIGPILKAESDLYRITMKDEGEASLDRRYWAFLLQGSNDDYRARYLFVWDRTEDRVVGLRKLSASESAIDWVGMSPKGSWVLIGSDHDNGGNLAGLVMADRALKQFHTLHYSTGHADVGIDTQGNEVIVMQNAQTDYIDLIPLDPTVRTIPPDGTYEGSGHVRLARLFYASDSPYGFNSGVHISCNFPGWCVISTHMEPGVQEKNWLDRSIVLVQLDPAHPRVYYLAKVYGTCSAYWEETHAAMSPDGSRVVWATNWNRQVGQEKVWLVELDLPRDWHRAGAR